MGKKLTVYMIDGTDNGPRTIEIGNWSGKAIHSPRASLKELMHRPEFSKPGVYILKSDPQEEFFAERIYIGEAEKVGRRLREHIQKGEKDFKECIFFTSKDEMLTKSHIKYIESKLVYLAREAKNCELENSNTPTESALSEADESDMEEFIRQIKTILPTAGYLFLIGNRSSIIEDSDEILVDSKKFFIKNKKFDASMVRSRDGFLVLEGSEANVENSKSIASGWIKIREKLIREGIWTREGNKYIFTGNYLFSSPSAASSVILGRQSAGTLEWIDTDKISYKDYETEGQDPDD